jgi:hypothetical protein
MTDPGAVPSDRLAVAAFFGHAGARASVGSAVPWPPTDAPQLYDWCWKYLAPLGKEPCVRAGLASLAWWPETTTGFATAPLEEREAALAAAVAWALDPTEERRREAGRVAARPGPYSMERTLANMAGARRHWVSAAGFVVTRNPHHVRADWMETVGARIAADLIDWALGVREPLEGLVARRFAAAR